MKLDIRNFIIGFIVGIISIMVFLFLAGNINIETEFEFGHKFIKIINLYI